MWKVIKYSLRLSGWMGFAFCLLFAIGMVVFLMMTDQQKYLKALPSGISMAAFMMPYYVFRIADKRISNDCLYLPAKPTDKFFGFQVPAITTMLILFCTTLPLLTLSDIEKENMISGLLLTTSVWSLSLYSSFLKPLTRRSCYCADETGLRYTFRLALCNETRSNCDYGSAYNGCLL